MTYFLSNAGLEIINDTDSLQDFLNTKAMSWIDNVPYYNRAPKTGALKYDLIKL